MFRSHRLVAILSLGCMLAMSPLAAHACAYCFSFQNNPLALPHPKAIEIAVATRAAIEKGHLKADRTIRANLVFPDGRGWVSMKQVPAALLVSSWAQKQGPALVDRQSVIVHFVFVDTGETCGLEMRNGIPLVQSKISAQSDLRLVTTKTAFHAVLSGKLGMAEARAMRILLVEGDADTRGLY